MTLIERLKESNRKFWESVDGIKSPEKIKFQIDQKLFTEIISTLEAQEERLKILEGADKAYFDQIPYVDSLVEKLARQEKLLGEAKPLVNKLSGMGKQFDCFDGKCPACEAKYWLAALALESDEK